MAINKQFSGKDFTHQSLVDVPVEQLNNTEIRNSCFYQEVAEDHVGDPLQKVFPDGMTGVRFVHCNLDNVLVPPGNTIDEKCSNKRIKVQNDLADWVLNSAGKPVEPVHKKTYQRLGLSVDPRDLPAAKLTESVTEKAEDIKRLTEERDKAQQDLNDRIGA